mgnify:CR=1 FL=1
MPKITPIHWRKFEKFLLYVGCVFKHQRGDHRIYNRPGLKRPVVLTVDTQVPIDHITGNLRTLGIDHNEYLEVLKKI